MQQLLKPPEGAEEPADKAPQQHADQNQDAGDIVRKFEFRRADDRLKRADGTCARRAGTRIAVQPRHADIFSRALIQRPLFEIRQVDVGQQRGTALYPSAKPGENMRFFLIQCQHTPYTAELPSRKPFGPPRAKRRSRSSAPRPPAKRTGSALFFVSSFSSCRFDETSIHHGG